MFVDHYQHAVMICHRALFSLIIIFSALIELLKFDVKINLLW